MLSLCMNMTYIGETTYYEKINVAKLNYIINNISKYEEVIKEEEKDMRRKHKNYTVYSHNI